MKEAKAQAFFLGNTRHHFHDFFFHDGVQLKLHLLQQELTSFNLEKSRISLMIASKLALEERSIEASSVCFFG